MKILIIDTNCILHNWAVLKSFPNCRIVLLYPILEELDKFKEGLGELAYNTKQAIRLLDGLRKKGSLVDGVEQDDGSIVHVSGAIESGGLDFDTVDNKIISTAVYMDEISRKGFRNSSTRHPFVTKGDEIILLTKDINLRIKADGNSLKAEDFIDVDNANEYNTGITYINVSDELAIALRKVEKGERVSEIVMDEAKEVPMNGYVVMKNNGCDMLDRLSRHTGGGRLVFLERDYHLFGIRHKNLEQRLAIDALLNDDIPLVTLKAQAGTGKAQPLDAKVLTPTGYVEMGSLKIGDMVLTPSGESAPVIGIFPQGKKDIFRVGFSDGASTECCDDHLWKVKSEKGRNPKTGKWQTLPLSEIKKTIIPRPGRNRWNWSIPQVEKLEFQNTELLPIDPYLLGVLLGDGSIGNTVVNFSTNDPEILNSVKSSLIEGYSVNKIKGDNYDYRIVMNTETRNYKTTKGVRINFYVDQLEKLGLLEHTAQFKFIPECYKWTSFENRLAILQGLMDTDGTVGKSGTQVTFTTISPRLSEDVKFLVESFGGKCVITSRYTHYTYKGEYKTGKLSYTLHISIPPDIMLFRLSRKIERVKPRTKYKPTRYINSAEFIGQKEAQCILIDHPEHLYITNNFIVTHNTLISLAAALQKVFKEGKYEKIVLTRPVIPIGNDLGFLPGTMFDKMLPYLRPFLDNLSVIKSVNKKKDKGKVCHDLEEMIKEENFTKFFEIVPITYMRGRSISNAFIIVDEAQNLEPAAMKTLVTRVGEGSKLVCVGDIDQIDNRFLSKECNGLSMVISKFTGQECFSHVTLVKAERSHLAEVATKVLFN